jgi:Ca2+-binding RTX toxin-like protein
LLIVSGQALIDTGVHTIEWTPLNAFGFQVGEPFVQLVHVGQWATVANCCSPGQTVVSLTQGNDTFLGISAPECVLAENGTDTVLTFGGADTIGGGRGPDTVLSGADGDVLVCEPGNDTALGGAGPDIQDGGRGQDTLDGDGGPDVLDGGADADVLTGGAGSDELRGRAGSDVLMGGGDPDKLYPGSGVDAVFGDGGDDELYLLDECELTPGKALFGGTGQDVLFVPAGISLADLSTAGVIVSSDVEQIVELTAPHTFESDCG